MKDLRADIHFIGKICEHQPEAAVWVKPVWSSDRSSEKRQIVDFQFHYCNSASLRLTGKNRDEIIGRCVLEDKLPDPQVCQTIFEQCLQVFETGQPRDYSYFSKDLGKYLTLCRVKVLDGVLTTARNRSEEHRIKMDREEQTKFLTSVVENSPYGICLYESVRDVNKRIIDFKLRLCNRKSAEITGLTLDQLYSMSVQELMTMRGHSGYFEICTKVVETGEAHYMEFYSDARNQWLGFSFVKFEDGYLLNYIDITETKRYERAANQNANELNAIFNGSLSAVYSASLLKDKEGKIYDLVFLRVNESFYKMFPNLDEAIAGKSLMSIAGNDDQSVFMQFVQEVMDTDRPAVHILQFHKPERWYEVSIVILDKQTISVTLNDITVQKTAAIEIERQRNLLDNIMKQSPNGLSITKAIRDDSGQMVDAISVLMNDACEKLNGIPNKVLLANTLGSLAPGLLKDPIFKIATELEVGASFRTEYFLPTTKRWLELAVARMDNEHFINVFTDMSATKEIQQQLEKSVAELKRSNANLEDFVYAASHDLKEPIRKIRFFTGQLKTDYGSLLDEKGLRVFDRLEVGAERMQLLIDDLLEYSLANQGVGKFEEINLQDTISKVLEDLELAIQENKAVITMDNLPVVRGNKRQLQQLFQNLIDNALKYHRPGTEHLVSISARTVLGDQIQALLSEGEKLKSYHLIEIKDNGIGFEQKDADRIFNVFTRLHGKGEYPGSGVGLSIVRKVVENHKGFVLAKSRSGEGATFNIFLPI